LCEDIDTRVNTFLNRPLEGDWPYIWIDATYVKTRQNGSIVSVAVIIAVGVNTDGRREVLGLQIGASEAEPFWTEFLRSLTRRGLRGVKLVISDAHEGIKAAVSKVFCATWQRCRVHFMRNALAHAGKSGRRVVSGWARADMVSQKIRQLTTATKAKNLTSRSAVRRRTSSALQPDFMILWKVSIFQRIAYHWSFFS
jgi:transposase-like protein